jgi:hypothetical protein
MVEKIARASALFFDQEINLSLKSRSVTHALPPACETVAPAMMCGRISHFASIAQSSRP